MSNNSEVKCPQCGFSIDIKELIQAGTKDEVEKQLIAQEQKYKDELSKIKAEKELVEKTFSQKEDELKIQLEKDYKSTLTKKEEEMKKKLQAEQKDAQDMLEKELEEKTAQLMEMNKLKAEKSKLEREKASLEDDLKAKFEQQLNDMILTEKIKITHQLGSDHEMVIAEYKKQIEDQKKLVEEMKRKQEQGSMQLQGEVQELAIENWLRERFPLDEVVEIGKGDMGADCLQLVNTRECLNCGKIYYESKRTKAFKQDWIDKFKNDIKEKGANIGVLVTQTYPKGMERMGLLDGIYICSYEEFKGLSMVLRESIIQISYIHKTQENRTEKTAMLYAYLTSNEFNMHVDGIVKTFINMKADLAAEKMAILKLWKKREKQLEIVTTNTVTMIGSIQGIGGKEIEANSFLSLTMIEE